MYTGMLFASQDYPAVELATVPSLANDGPGLHHKTRTYVHLINIDKNIHYYYCIKLNLHSS